MFPLQLHFKPDIGTEFLELTHWVKLYEDRPSTGNKKAVVVHEQYEELVLVCPPRAFFNRYREVMESQYNGPPYTEVRTAVCAFRTEGSHGVGRLVVV